MGWVVLFVIQAALASTGRTDLHRILGKVAVGYALLLVLVGLLTTFNQLTNGIAAGKAEEAQLFLLVPLTDMIVFPILFGAAIAYRKKTEIHRRLMLVTTTYLLIAPAARVDLEAFMALELSFFAIWMSPIFLAMAYDFITRRRLHPVYFIGLAVLAISMIRVPLRETEAWLGIAKRLSALVT